MSLLDVACGAGDVAIGVARRARQEGVTLVVDACDISPNAIAYAPTTRTVANRDGSRPLGKARKRCMKSTAATRSKTIPRVHRPAAFDQERLDTKIPNPAATIRTPKGPGRRDHSTRPATT